MALASLVLVLAEHRRRPAVRRGRPLVRGDDPRSGSSRSCSAWCSSPRTPVDESFAALRAAARSVAGGRGRWCSWLTLLGSAPRPGIVPLHVWLPRAHPEAPSHVSALMSAAMVNLGVYGILRVGFDLLGGGPRWWWLLVLALGAVSALYGSCRPRSRTDLKRLLGYSTTENMGLVLIGVGAAGMFAADGRPGAGRAGAGRGAAARGQPRRVQDPAVPGRRVGAARHRHPRPRRAGRAARRRMPATTALVRARRAGARPRCRRATGSSREWLLLQGLIHGLPASSARSLPRRDAARRRRGRADRRAGGGHLREGVRGRVPGPAPQPEAAAAAAESPARRCCAGMGIAGGGLRGAGARADRWCSPALGAVARPRRRGGRTRLRGGRRRCGCPASPGRCRRCC